MAQGKEMKHGREAWTGGYMLIVAAFAMMISLAALSGCTRIETISLDLSKSEVINTTKIDNATEMLQKNLSEMEVRIIPSMDSISIAPDELTEPYSGSITKGLCVERVLIGKRACSIVNDTLNMTITNPGFENVTMIFYIMSGQDEIANVSSSYLLKEKEEASYIIPLDYINYRYGNSGKNALQDGKKIDKIYATPVLSTPALSGQPTQMSCSNKNLPILLGGCTSS